MSGLRGVLVVLVLIVIAFAGGFLVGRRAVGELRSDLKQIETQNEQLRGRLSETEARGLLADALAGLSQIYVDLTEDNYGRAREALRRVNEKIGSAYEAAHDNEAVREQLSQIRGKLHELEGDLVAVRAEARDKVVNLVDDVRRLVEE